MNRFMFALLFASFVISVPFKDSPIKRQDCGAPICDDKPNPKPDPKPSPTPTEPPPIAPVTLTPVPTLTPLISVLPTFFKGCNKDQKDKFNKAWKEAGTLANAHAEWSPPGAWFGKGAKWMDAMETYLGTDVKIDNPYFSKYGPLQQNILREKSIHEWSVWSTGDSTLNVYCDESKLPGIKRTECDQPNTPGLRVTAYTFSDDGLLLAFKYLILCPRFFDTDIKTLEQLTTDARDNHNMTLQTTMDPWRKTGARVVFHESYHWGHEVSKPVCDRSPEVYTPQNVVKLAKDENVEESKLNAESWTQAAMAIYVQKEFGWKKAPRPAPASMNDIEEKSLKAPPAGFVAPWKNAKNKEDLEDQLKKAGFEK